MKRQVCSRRSSSYTCGSLNRGDVIIATDGSHNPRSSINKPGSRGSRPHSHAFPPAVLSLAGFRSLQAAFPEQPLSCKEASHSAGASSRQNFWRTFDLADPLLPGYTA